MRLSMASLTAGWRAASAPSSEGNNRQLPRSLLSEWASRRQRDVRQAQLWSLTLLLSVIALLGGAAYLVYRYPQLSRERALWHERLERMEREHQEPPAPPFPTEQLRNARLRTQEFNLILLAITRLLPRAATLHEATIAHQPDTGLTITLRGSTQGFEPVRIYTERLRGVGLFADVTPLSVTRNQAGEASAQAYSQFEIRLIVPTSSDSAETPEGGNNP
jgi:Tfp pilus assembly protein PilN